MTQAQPVRLHPNAACPGYPQLSARRKQRIVRLAQNRLVDALSQASAPVGVRRGTPAGHPVRAAYQELRNPHPGDFVFDQRFVQAIRELTDEELDALDADEPSEALWLMGMVTRYISRQEGGAAVCELPDGRLFLWESPQLVKIELQESAPDLLAALEAADVPVADWCHQCGQIVRRPRVTETSASDPQWWKHDVEPTVPHVPLPWQVLEEGPFDGSESSPTPTSAPAPAPAQAPEPQIDDGHAIEGSADGIEWLRTDGHQIQFGGANGDGYCYAHQSFDCLDQLQRAAEAKRSQL